MKFTGIQQYTQIDYPGHIACVVFTPGCNLRCPFCYNPESVLPELLKQQTSNLIDASAVLNFLRTRR
ncbi:MAG: 4Fe-4S cluster-binding domain-containing protein [Candidatus Peribacteria bacterium]|nr:MAG: 4Fe-4S cluster-binding domain-containing protein [Candidatus Peribacteria bacterium]